MSNQRQLPVCLIISPEVVVTLSHFQALSHHLGKDVHCVLTYLDMSAGSELLAYNKCVMIPLRLLKIEHIIFH
jgi:hypothetical protein